jgi:hypothetical protein
MRLYIVFVFCVVLAGCMTQYAPKSISGGYSEVRLNEDTIQISVEGNGFTSKDRARNIALLRAAELTLNSGYGRFVIVEKTLSMDTVGKEDTDIYKINGMTLITGGEPIRKPDGLFTIRMVRPKDPDFATAYDARLIAEQLHAVLTPQQ